MSLVSPERIRSLQKKLYIAAKANPERRFHQLYDKIYREDILGYAYHVSHEKGGAPGVDGMTFEEVEKRGVGEWLKELREEIRNETYRSQPVRRVMIPKPGGGERPLGIPTIRDRVVQTAAVMILEPIFEADFVDEAYGYRPRRSAHGAISTVHQSLKEGYTDIVDADLTKYFDTIPHDALMRCVARRIVDRRMLHLIKMWLKVPVEECGPDGNRRRSGGKDQTRGTPQGGVISPLLANIYMHRFLKGWRNQRKGEQYRARIVNYADDFVILSRGHARSVLEWTRRAMTRIGLTLNEQKTCLRDAKSECFTFLGYTFGPLTDKRNGRRYLGAEPSQKAQKRLREKIARILNRGNVAPWNEVVQSLNSLLRGWQNYFSYGTLSRAYDSINWNVLDRVRYLLRKRHRVPTQCAWRRFPARVIYSVYGVHKLRRLKRGHSPCAAM